jgi:glycosyltransferase involved in cell wall biosynthesis
VEKQAQQLRHLGHDVTIVTGRLKKHWERRTVLSGLPIYRVGGIYMGNGTLRIGRLGIWPVSVGIFLFLLRQRRTYDVIHVSQISPLAAAAALIGMLTRKPVVTNVMGVGKIGDTSFKPQQRTELEAASSQTDRAVLHIDSRILRADAQDDVSDLLRNTLGGREVLNFLRKSNSYYRARSTRSISYLSAWKFPRDRIIHIPGGVDIEKFRPAPQQRPDSSSPERVIICVARLEYVKGVDVLLDAWERMISTSSEWPVPLLPRLLLVGDGALRCQLERIVEGLNIGESVKFLGMRSDVIDLLQRSWAFVLPSRSEGMPNALLEAMACGLPCIATRVSGSEDIISDGANGILVEPGEPDQIASALRSIITDAELAERVGRAARATVLLDYQLTQSVDRCLALYRELLAEANINSNRRRIRTRAVTRR